VCSSTPAANCASSFECKKIKQQLAEAEQRHAEILAKAMRAQKMIEEGAPAPRICRSQTTGSNRGSRTDLPRRAKPVRLNMSARWQLKRELGRLVVETRRKYWQSFDADDQRRLQEERQHTLR